VARLRSISIVSLATSASRVLGLIRDVCMFAFLGTGPVSSAFILAFTLPNLFRRLLGEGALTSAVVPVLSRKLEQEGEAAQDALLNAVLRRLFLTLLGLSVLLGIGWWGLPLIPGLAERWYLSSGYGLMLTPYLVLICLAAILSAALNVRQRFLVPALSQVWLNLSMIAALGGFGWALAETPEARAWWLAGGVLVGGVLQWLTPWLDLQQVGWDRRAGRGEPVDLRPVWRLFLPGVFGAAIFQVNVLVSRLLAFSLNDQATGILYLANRLIELPLGVFAVAVSTVLFPELARYAAREDGQETFAEAYHHGWRLIMLITVPAALGLAVLAGPILSALFAWGLFAADDVAATIPPLQIFAIAVPFYSWATLATRAFHAQQDMRTPVRLAVLNLLMNLGLSLLLMGPYGTSGLALANLLTSVTHCMLLAVLLRRYRVPLLTPTTGLATVKIIAAGAVMAGAIVWLKPFSWDLLARLETLFAPTWAEKLLNAGLIALLIPLGVVVYFGTLVILREGELHELLTVIRKKLGR